jgi:hypothetical protein
LSAICRRSLLAGDFELPANGPYPESPATGLRRDETNLADVTLVGDAMPEKIRQQRLDQSVLNNV